MVGLGTSYFLASIKCYPKEFEIKLDSSSWVTLARDALAGRMTVVAVVPGVLVFDADVGGGVGAEELARDHAVGERRRLLQHRAVAELHLRLFTHSDHS